MILSRSTLTKIHSDGVSKPDGSIFELPERVLQFGTGALLRGLPDYFIDNANRNGIFNGRIVVVKSTDQGDPSPFDGQDGLYTLCVRGLQNGQKIEENIINGSISRVLNAANQWAQVLACAHNQRLQIIISNTTEVGIKLTNDDVRGNPPKSFPGKLLAFLYERYKVFGGSVRSGMIIIPTELIPDNGKKLESIVLELAHLNGLEDSFIEWLENHNTFCSSLVDRIVPGKPAPETQTLTETQLGYTDSLLIVSESYRLWAIEGSEQLKRILSFAWANEGVVIRPDIDIFRELKLRLLNGTHTLSSGVAFLAGFKTVRQAMDDDIVSGFITELMLKEIATSIPYSVSLLEAQTFGKQVLDRFRNPYIQHAWINITMQYSSKMKLRCIPVLLNHYKRNRAVPELFALGFAAYLYFTKPVVKKGDHYFGELNGESYPIKDDRAELFYNRWKTLSTRELVEEILKDTDFWGEDLHALPGFAQAVTDKLNLINGNDIIGAIESVVEKNGPGS